MTAPVVPVRLADGDSSTGLVEVYYSGRWGLVCGNNWGDLDAQVWPDCVIIYTYRMMNSLFKNHRLFVGNLVIPLIHPRLHWYLLTCLNT